jgi:hypothetical protein
VYFGLGHNVAAAPAPRLRENRFFVARFAENSTGHDRGSALSVSVPGSRCGRGTSSVAARRHNVVWSGTRSGRPSRPMMEPIKPSVWRNARRNTARSVSCRQDGQGRIPGLAASGRAWLSRPRRDRLRSEPDCQATALTQAGLAVRPVGYPLALSRNMVTAVLVQLEGHGGASGSEREPRMPGRLPEPQTGPCTTATPVARSRSISALTHWPH